MRQADWHTGGAGLRSTASSITSTDAPYPENVRKVGFGGWKDTVFIAAIAAAPEKQGLFQLASATADNTIRPNTAKKSGQPKTVSFQNPKPPPLLFPKMSGLFEAGNPLLPI